MFYYKIKSETVRKFEIRLEKFNIKFLFEDIYISEINERGGFINTQKFKMNFSDKNMKSFNNAILYIFENCKIPKKYFNIFKKHLKFKYIEISNFYKENF